MNVLFLIGNGFDINAGMQTSARSFVESYKSHLDDVIAATESPDEWQRMLSDSIEREGIDTWSAFEESFGRFSGEVESCENPVAVFKAAYEDFLDFFYQKISTENDRAETFEIDDSVLNRFKDGTLSLLSDGMRSFSKNNILSIRALDKSLGISFVSFNYTTLLDRIVAPLIKANPSNVKAGTRSYSCIYDMPLHVHGTLSDDHGLIIGVDNSEQIIGPTCSADTETNHMFVKSEQCLRSEDLRRDRALSLIDRANVICVYGMSLGVTDCTWWKKIGDWISDEAHPGRRLVLFSCKPEVPPYRSYEYPAKRDELISRFCDRAGLDGAAGGLHDGDKEKILVSFGSTAFDLFSKG